jgi:hypothetical protein
MKDREDPMVAGTQYEFGSDAWADMQQREVIAGFARAGWPDDVRFSLVERYRGGQTLPGGRIPGFRVDVAGSRATFRRGVASDETGDVTLDVAWNALRELVHMSSHDKDYASLNERLRQSGSIVRHGAFELLEAVSRDVHHQVFLQTL